MVEKRLRPHYALFCSWDLSRLLMLRDFSHIDNILHEEYVFAKPPPAASTKLDKTT